MALVERPLGKAARQLDAELHLAAQRLERRDEEPVLRSPRDRQVELEVRLDRRAARGDSALHRVDRQRDAVDRALVVRDRRAPRRLALEPASELEAALHVREVLQRPEVEAARIAPSQHEVAGALARCDQALRAQAPERLPQHRPRDAELARELELRGQPAADRVTPRRDLLGESVVDLVAELLRRRGRRRVGWGRSRAHRPSSGERSSAVPAASGCRRHSMLCKIAQVVKVVKPDDARSRPRPAAGGGAGARA